MVVENFPQNITQAKYFVRNGTVPSDVFTLKCSKDICQERMLDLGESHPRYVSSAILSKKFKKYNEDMADLLPFFRDLGCQMEVATD